MAESQSSRQLNAKTAVELLKSPMTNGEVMRTFKITPKGFADLLRQLFEKKLISEQDMIRRGIKFRIQKKEAAAKPPAPVANSTLKPAPPQPPESEEEFLDTLALTELLSFKPEEPTPSNGSEAEMDQAEEIKIEDIGPGKKSRLSITGFFKKLAE